MDYQTIQHEFDLESDLFRYQTLQQWLKYETYAMVVWVAAFFAPVDVIAFIAALAALAFVPIMVKELVAVKQFNWIVIWALATLIPAIAVYFAGPRDRKIFWALVAFAVASYVFFRVFGRTVNKWARQQASHLELTKRKATEQAKLDMERKSTFGLED